MTDERTTFTKADYDAWKRDGEVADRARDGVWNLEFTMPSIAWKAVAAEVEATIAAEALNIAVPEIRWFRELSELVAEKAIENSERGLFRAPFSVRGSSGAGANGAGKSTIWLSDDLLNAERDVVEVVHHECYHLANPDAPEHDADRYGKSAAQSYTNAAHGRAVDHDAEWEPFPGFRVNPLGGERPEKNTKNGLVRWVFVPAGS